MNELFYLSEDQRMIRDLARKIARERIAPRAAHYDETETYPEESIRALMDAGLYGIWLPEEYGGTAMGRPALALVREEIAWAWPATATHYPVPPPAGPPSLLAATAAPNKKHLPPLAT